MLTESTKRTWTPDQHAAITHAGGGLLVSAAAGSGKTSVLAERCAHVVCDAADSCAVHELLVVTFTEAAAAEMKGRIRKALFDRHAAKPDDDHVARQLAMLDRASISTLHAFCARLLRQHFNLLGLDPNFRILDGDEATLLKQEVATDLFAQRYESTDDAGVAFRALVDQYGDGNDQRLAAEVIAGHESLCSVVDPAGWAVDARDRLAELADRRPLKETQLGKLYVDGVMQELESVRRACEAAGRFVRDLGGFDGYVAHLRDMYQLVKHLIGVLDAHGIDAAKEEADGIEIPKLKPVSSKVPNKELAKQQVDRVNAAIKAGPWRKRLAYSTAQWREGSLATAPHADTLLGLIDAFGQGYAAAKDEQGALDFNDLERRTLDVLTGADGGPSAVARSYHALYRHVMVDEFQDINAVQDAILCRISRECLAPARPSNLFCVGDVKQSIYRFRLADPAQFIRRRTLYGDPAHGRVIDLQQNFRSRGLLLDAVNGIFRKLMTAESADIDYDDSQRLVPGAAFPAPDDAAFAGSPIELHLMPTSTASGEEEPAGAGGDDGEAELDRAQREAVMVGHRVLEIVGRRTVVDRDGTVRAARFGDCVVLLRSTQFKGETFARQLRAMNIPVHTESRTGYFEATEINDVLSLLHVLDNGHQDVPLAAVLRSPLGNLPDAEDALARIRLAYPASGGDAVPFHQAVRLYAAEQKDELAAHLEGVLANLTEWRRIGRERPVADLLWAIYEQTGYLGFCGGLPRGEQRQANLIQLYDKAKQFGTFRRQGLGKFLVFLEKLRDQSDIGQAAVASEADDVVRIMSVHRSKGLEFPVVFVPDLGKLINTSDLSGSILLHRDLGLGLRVVDEARQVRYPSLAWTVVQQSLRQQTLAEELRVLYVALTRAKEHLVLIGTADESAMDRWRQQWADHDGPLPSAAFLDARTPLDWLGPVAANLGESAIAVTIHAPSEVAAWTTEQAGRPAPSPERLAHADLQPLDPAPAPSPVADAVIEQIGRPYPFESATRVKAAAAVTELAKRGVAKAWRNEGGVVSQEGLPALPKFMAGEVPARAVDTGAATHRVLELLDFASADSAEQVQAQIAQMASAGRLSPEMARLVDVPAIVWLMSTEVGQRLRDAAASPRRELPVSFTASDDGDLLDQPMVRGRLDLVVPDGDGWMIVDYKTDRVTGPLLDEREESYAAQMAHYRTAVTRITGQPVTRAVLVFLHPRELRWA